MTGHVKVGLALLAAVGAVLVGIVGVQVLTSGTPEPSVGDVVEVRDGRSDAGPGAGTDAPTTPTTPASPSRAPAPAPLPAAGEAGSGRAPGLVDDDDDRFEDSPSQPRDLRGDDDDDDDDEDDRDDDDGDDD